MATKDDQAETPDLTAAQSLSLGDSYFVDENYAGAVDAYAAALLVLRDTDDLALHMRILSHRSAAFYRQQRYDDAIDDAEQALQLTAAGLRPGESEICHKRAGMAAMNMQKWKKAKAFFVKAQELATLNHGNYKTYNSLIRQCDYSLKPRDPPPDMELPPSFTGTIPALGPATAAISSATEAAAPTPVAAAAPSRPVVKTSPQAPDKKPAPKINPNTKPVTGMPKYQYYQNDKFMTVALLESNVQAENLTVDFQPTHLTVILRKGNDTHTVICGNLYSDIDVEHSKVNIKDEKVLIKLRKVEAFEWHELLGKGGSTSSTTTAKPDEAGETKQDEEGTTVAPPLKIPTVDTSKPRPYASHRDWDKIEKELENQEKEEKPQGDDAMNKLFQQIYQGADEDTRRAMIKSYQTSGGTVLSTNWDEVAKKDYEKERTAPKGMEWKNWEGDKLPQAED